MITGNTASGTFYVFNKKEQSTPIVFVHGVGLTYEIWQPQLDFFKDLTIAFGTFLKLELSCNVSFGKQ